MSDPNGRSDAPLRLAVCGLNGRLGRAVAELAATTPALRIVGGIGRAAGHGPRDLPIVSLEGSEGLLAETDVLLDVSAPDATAALLEVEARVGEGRALVIGTTGLDATTDAHIDELAHGTAVLTAANFSMGVTLLETLVARAAAALPAGRFDIEIVETHHAGKVDAPSGTALTLGRAAAAARGTSLPDVRLDGRSGTTGPRAPGQIGLHALRGGAVPGEHRVHFLGGRERIELAHQALDRMVFAEGALAAVLWIAGRQPGRYRMADVLGL